MKAITRDIYIADEIRYKIEIGEFKPHDKLPSERQFCEIFDCQRATVRLALESLLDEGWIYCVERSGYYVSEPRILETLNVVSSIKALFAIPTDCFLPHPNIYFQLDLRLPQEFPAPHA